MFGTGSVLNTGDGSSIGGFTNGVAISGDADVQNLDGASISGGSNGVRFDSTGSLTNGGGSSISGGEGLRAADVTTVDNAGSIEGTDGDGVDAQAYGSSLTNHDGGTISGTSYGADVGGDVTNDGAGSEISSDNVAVRTQGGATMRNENGAAVEGEHLGVEMYDGGDVYNTGGSTITSNSGDGVDVWAYGSVTNSGEGSSIQAGGFAGVYFAPFGIDDVVFTLTNSDKATISANSYGVDFDGAAGVLTNEGGASITSISGSAVQMTDGGTVTNRSGGVITGLVTGLNLTGDGTYTVDNKGAGTEISATGDEADGIYAAGPATITNSGGALISGTRFGAWLDDGGSVTNAGEGTIISGLSGIYAWETTTVVNKTGASISGVNAGVDLEGTGSVTNMQGASISASDSDSGVGVVMADGGTLTNKSGASISGGIRGVQGWGADILNTGAGSTITSDGTAVQTWSGGGSVTNADGATMHGNENGVLLDISSPLINEDGAKITGDTDDGVLSYDGGTVTNSGSGSAIKGGNSGIWLQGGLTTVTNEDGATITGTGGSGVVGYGGGTVSNSGDGSKIGGGISGIEIHDGSGTVTNTGGAKVTGGYGAVGLFEGGSVTNGAGSTLDGAVFGIYVEGGSATISNAGRIAGDVELDGGHTNDVTLYSGGSIDGNLYMDNLAGSTLTFDGSGTQKYSKAVTGFTSFGGTLIKQGSGTWIIDKNFLANETSVTDGSLIVGLDGVGSLISDVTVDAGALLGGSGTIHGDVTVNGTVAPGNSPGTLTIVGDYNQGVGSTYEAQIDPASGLHDDIVVSGTATIDPTATIHFTRIGSAPYAVGTQYVFLSAASVNGAFVATGDLAISPFLSLADHYSLSTGYLEVVQTQSLAVALPGNSPNQSALVNGLQSAPASPIFTALANLPSVAAVTAALPLLTGEIHASVAGTMLDDSRLVRNAAIDRLRDAPCSAVSADASRNAATGTTTHCGAGPVTTWSSVIGSWGRDDSSDDVAEMDRSVGGFLAGADTMLGDAWRAGVLGGYSRSHFDVGDRLSSATSDDYHLGLYAGTLPGALALRFGGIYTWHRIQSDRTVSFPGLTNHLTSDYNAGTGQVFGEAGYRIPGTGDAIEPFVNLAYVDQRSGRFNETGGIAALTDGKADGDILFATLGLHGAACFRMGRTDVTAKGTLGWRHASGDTRPASEFEIGGGSSFTVKGLPVPKDAAVAQAGLEFANGSDVRFGISSDAQIGDGGTNLGLRGNLSVSF